MVVQAALPALRGLDAVEEVGRNQDHRQGFAHGLREARCRRPDFGEELERAGDVGLFDRASKSPAQERAQGGLGGEQLGRGRAGRLRQQTAMVLRRPAQIERGLEIDRFDNDLGELRILAPDVALLLFPLAFGNDFFGIGGRPAVAVSIANPDQQSGIFALRAALPREFLDAPAECKLLRGFGGDVDERDLPRRRLRVGAVAQRNAHAGVGRMLAGQFRAGAYADQELAFVGERVRTGDEGSRAAEPIGPVLAHLVCDRLRRSVGNDSRRGARDDCGTQAAARGFQVILQLQRRHAQRRAVVLESVAAELVRRQVFRVVEIETQQVAHGVAVLDSI